MVEGQASNQPHHSVFRCTVGGIPLGPHQAGIGGDRGKRSAAICQQPGDGVSGKVVDAVQVHVYRTAPVAGLQLGDGAQHLHACARDDCPQRAEFGDRAVHCCLHRVVVTNVRSLRWHALLWSAAALRRPEDRRPKSPPTPLQPPARPGGAPPAPRCRIRHQSRWRLHGRSSDMVLSFTVIHYTRDTAAPIESALVDAAPGARIEVAAGSNWPQCSAVPARTVNLPSQNTLTIIRDQGGTSSYQTQSAFIQHHLDMLADSMVDTNSGKCLRSPNDLNDYSGHCGVGGANPPRGAARGLGSPSRTAG